MEPQASDDQFLALLLTNQDRIFRFVLSLVPSRSDSEDLFQQTCMTLWQNRQKYDPTAGEFSSWAFAIAHNHVRNFRRKESSRNKVLVSFDEGVEAALIATRQTHGGLLDQWHKALEHCVDHLNPRQRSILDQCYFADVPIKEVSKGFGSTPNALYKTLRRIREILHECVQKTTAAGGEL